MNSNINNDSIKIIVDSLKSENLYTEVPTKWYEKYPSKPIANTIVILWFLTGLIVILSHKN